MLTAGLHLSITDVGPLGNQHSCVIADTWPRLLDKMVETWECTLFEPAAVHIGQNSFLNTDGIELLI